LGVRQHPANHLHTRLHRRSHSEAERSEGPQPRRVLPPDAPCRLLHQLRQIPGKTEAEQQIWNECSRLIANTIIFYNTLLLSRVYEQKVAAADLEAIKILKGISPVAWRNINLIGNFDLTTNSTPIDIEALATRYQNQDFWHRSMSEAEGDGPPV
jgi:Tn3 transposase DDE domain